MIEFRQKEFAEFDAMKSLYEELMRKDSPWRFKINVISQDSLLPVLKGNNVVIERFVISTRFMRREKFRMYLKVGAKAKMPEALRLPGRPDVIKLGNASFTMNGTIKAFSEVVEKQKEFDNKKGGGDGGPGIKTSFRPVEASIQIETTRPQGETLLYDKKARTIVFEFDSIRDAVQALNILPFGLNYKIYLLDV